MLETNWTNGNLQIQPLAHSLYWGPQEWRIQNQVERSQEARKAIVLLIFTHHEKKMMTVIKLIQTFSTKNFRDLCICTPYSILLFFFITFPNITVNCKLLQHVETCGSKKNNTQYRDIWYYIIHSTQWLIRTKKNCL